MKTLLDLTPAAAFFVAYLAAGIYVATAVLIGALFLLVIIYRVWRKEWHKAHLATAIIAGLLGGITLYIHDPAFIKFKPTAVYAVFSLALLGSHVIGEKVLLARLPQQMFQFPDSLWRKVNFAWALFFAVCALLNLWVAAQFDEATWVKFKTFGFTALMFVFLLAHAPFVGRYLSDLPSKPGAKP